MCQANFHEIWPYPRMYPVEKGAKLQGNPETMIMPPTSHSIVLYDHMSLAVKQTPLMSCSGAAQMYVPPCVAKLSVEVSIRPKPRSAIFTFLSSVISRLGVLRSLWQQPFSCRHANPAATAKIACRPLYTRRFSAICKCCNKSMVNATC